MKTKLSVIIIVIALIFIPSLSFADELADAMNIYKSGDLIAAAEAFSRYASAHPDDQKTTPEAITYTGRSLDAIADYLTGQAEKTCYWNKGGNRSPDCMQRYAEGLNAKYGDGAFRYEHALTFIFYTGSHYKKLLDRFPKSPYAPEAEFYLLLRRLAGHPDDVLPRIKSFLSKYPKGEWNKRGLLLWARVNEDIWFIHRKWSWVLYNYEISPEDLMIKAEPFRQEALKTFETLMKDKGSFEGKAAAAEYALLKENRENGIIYSILDDATTGTLVTWGLNVPTPKTIVTTDSEKSGIGMGRTVRPKALIKRERPAVYDLPDPDAPPSTTVPKTKN